MIKIKAIYGEHIVEYAKRLIGVLNCEQRNKLEGEFYGISFVVTNDSTIESIIEDYERQCQKTHEEYTHSEEYKIKKEREKMELKHLNKQANEYMNQLNTVDFNNYGELLKWLECIQPLTNTMGINTLDHQMVDVFMNNGFEPNVNTGEDLIEEDEENFARYIIGQCLDQLQDVGAIHPMVVVFIEQWKNKFKKNG